MVEPPHLRLVRNDAPLSGRGSGLTKHADILLYAWRGDRHCCVDLVGVSSRVGGMLPLPFSLWSNAGVISMPGHAFDFFPLGFTFFGSIGPAAEEMLDSVCRRYVSHAHFPPREAPARR